MTQSLKGKTALVTGASRGIGRAIAERLAKDGATVALNYNASKSGADEAVVAIQKAGGTAFAIQADLVDPATVPALFERLDDEFTKRNGSKALDWSAPSEVIHPVSWSEDHFGWNERWQGSGTSRKRSSPSCGR